MAAQIAAWAGWLGLAIGLLITGSALLIPERSRYAGALILLSAVLTRPCMWTWLTVASSPDLNLPTAREGGERPLDEPNPGRLNCGTTMRASSAQRTLSGLPRRSPPGRLRCSTVAATDRIETRLFVVQ